ncbi:hypothetical protein HOG47_03075 [archaeon]|jgi:uncharacterized spore protein YtfJ|nr:hypothetical protein [archaeon]
MNSNTQKIIEKLNIITEIIKKIKEKIFNQKEMKTENKTNAKKYCDRFSELEIVN